jgi:hypothetical protein
VSPWTLASHTHPQYCTRQVKAVRDVTDIWADISYGSDGHRRPHALEQVTAPASDAAQAVQGPSATEAQCEGNRALAAVRRLCQESLEASSHFTCRHQLVGCRGWSLRMRRSARAELDRAPVGVADEVTATGAARYFSRVEVGDGAEGSVGIAADRHVRGGDPSWCWIMVCVAGAGFVCSAVRVLPLSGLYQGGSVNEASLPLNVT